MKKSMLFIVGCLLPLAMLTAQEFNSGTNVINVGLGLGGNFGDFQTSSVSPGLSISYERGIWDVGGPGVISLGGYIGTKSYRYRVTGIDSKWSYTVIGVRGAYHFNGLEVENLDIYGGAMLSYNIANFSGDSVGFRVRSAVAPTVFVGGRWYFTDTFAGFAELGYGAAYLTIGGSLRF